MIGKTLSHYRVTAALGAGGMGEVYRATDTKLGRDVAIKVLPPDVTEDPERLGRFQREAHLLAALNHPNVAAIYGLEEVDGQPFLVLELVEGEDLAARLKRGAIPVDETLEIGRQIAEGLEAAHEEGIVHRDLKPANVKLTPDGRVKVLDFGLAKAWAGDAGSSGDVSQSPTLAHTGTRAGVILGTAAYMSPEQARGRAVDRRADVWSFGVLLWEMLTGRSLFAGDTMTDVIAAVMTKEPDLGALPAATPRAVRQLVGRCLRKDPRTRLPDIGAARLELAETIAGTTYGAGAHEPDGARLAMERGHGERWAWAAGFLVAAGFAAVVGFLHFTEAPEARSVGHFVLDTPEGVSLGVARGFVSLPAVSPDGRQVTFVGRPRGGPPQLWMRPLDVPEVRALPGTEDASRPFWSPDGGQIAFAAEGELKRLTLDGGRVERVCVLPEDAFQGGTWNEAGTIVFSSGYPTPNLFSVPAAGGEAQPLTTLDESRGELGHSSPRFLPDGRHVLFVVSSTQEEERGLHVTSVEEPDQRRRLLAEPRSAGYASGYLLFVRSRTLFAQPFDAGRLEGSGEAVRVAENVASWGVDSTLSVFGVSRDGVLAYLDSEDRPRVQLTWLDRTGQQLGTLGEPNRYFQISLSPDGRRVVSQVRDSRGSDLWVIDVSRGVARRVTNDPRGESDAVWSPDSQELLYAMHSDGGPDLFRTSLGGGASATPVLETPGEKWPEDWSRHGNTVLYASGGAFWALSLVDGGPPEVVLRTGARQDESHLSPDGRWLAYTSDLSGGWETYVEPFRRPGESVRVSVDGGGQPRWRADGKELFFVSRRNMLTAVEVQEGANGLEVGLPTELFEVPIVTRPQLDEYAVSADGQRFLVKAPIEGDPGERIHVVTNWTSLLE
jgi:Tol biopolymer transport system component